MRLFSDGRIRHRYQEFTSPGQEPPAFNTARQAVESVRSQKRTSAGQPALQPDNRIREWMKSLHPYSHLSRVGVRYVMTIDEEFTNYRLGPNEDESHFRACIAQALPVVGAHIEAMDNLRQQAGRPPIAELWTYVDRVQAWQKAQPEIIDALEQGRESPNGAKCDSSLEDDSRAVPAQRGAAHGGESLRAVQA